MKESTKNKLQRVLLVVVGVPCLAVGMTLLFAGNLLRVAGWLVTLDRRAAARELQHPLRVR